MRTSATLKGVPDSLGRRTVYIRIADGNKRKFYATKIKLDPKHWNKKVIGRVDAKVLNDRIKVIIERYEAGGEQKDVNFYKYAIKCISGWEHSKRGSTLGQLQSKVGKFKDFADVNLSDVTADLLTGYVNYCKELGNVTNTIWTSLKAVRVIINQAYKERLIMDNPFRAFSMPKYTDPQKVYLTKEQVGEIEEFVRSAPDQYKIAGGWFLISCYTGLRFGDQKAFNKGKIKAGRLIVYTGKTGKVVSMKMNDKLKSLFELVNYQPVPFTNEHYNRVLKAIAAECEIPERVTVHTARHTFGTLCASAGISQEVTAKLMGHESLRSTAIYYQLTGERIDSELDKIF